MVDINDLFRQAAMQQQPMSGMGQYQSDSYTPTSGAQMEADSRSSADSAMDRLLSMQERNHQNDRNMQWMSFFGKLASSKSPTLLGGLGEASGALADTTGKQQQANKLLEQATLGDQLKYEEWKQEQERLKQQLQETSGYHSRSLDIEQEKADQGKFTPVKDMFGNVTAVMDSKTGKIIHTGGNPDIAAANLSDPSDPQTAALQILQEHGTPLTPVASRQDITGRNAQAKAYNDAALAAKSTLQQLDVLDAQTGKYTPGKGMNLAYGAESAVGMGGEGASARAEADKASKALANSFMQASVGAKGSGIRMVQFDAGAVPNPDMPDAARTELIDKNKAIANSQVQRQVISDLYPRYHTANVNTIMDDYEAKNPPLIKDKPNPNWMPYQDWLAAGRPNTTSNGDKPKATSSGAPINIGGIDYSHEDLMADARRRGLVK